MLELVAVAARLLGAEGGVLSAGVVTVAGDEGGEALLPVSKATTVQS